MAKGQACVCRFPVTGSLQTVTADVIQGGSDSGPWISPWKEHLTQDECRVLPLRVEAAPSVEKDQSSEESHRKSDFSFCCWQGKEKANVRNGPIRFGSSPDISIFFGSSLAIAGANWWWSH